MEERTIAVTLKTNEKVDIDWMLMERLLKLLRRLVGKVSYSLNTNNYGTQIIFTFNTADKKLLKDVITALGNFRGVEKAEVIEGHKNGRK